MHTNGLHTRVYNVFGSCPLLLPLPVSLPFLLVSFFPASPSDTFTSFAECLKLNEFKEGCLQAPSQQPQPLKTPLHLGQPLLAVVQGGVWPHESSP